MSKIYDIVTIIGPRSISAFADELKESVEVNAARAINKTRDRARKKASDQIRDEIAFPASYVSASSKRLRTGKAATPGQLEATVVAQDRPTSLAQFLVGPVRRQTGVRLRIEPGKTIKMERAFTVNLNTGGDTKGNLGIAVRTSSGGKPSNAYRPRKLAAKAWLLYGPSVGQTFRTLINVDPKYIAEIETYLEAEFLRLMNREGLR